jgi:predicted lysophospholipase L1 biosynthesis ABC-type transport system permease subunit
VRVLASGATLLPYTRGTYLTKSQERKPARSNLKAPMHSNIVYFPARRVQILSYSVSAILCAVLLVGAMACLGAINQRSWKLSIGMVAVFIFMFAAFVALLTNAKRSEVFASTAAYAAVLVVYVGSGVGPGGRATQENG